MKSFYFRATIIIIELLLKIYRHQLVHTYTSPMTHDDATIFFDRDYTTRVEKFLEESKKAT